MIDGSDNKLVAITGSSGFIGRKLIKVLPKNNLRLLVRQLRL